ncbi:choice-of-anchor D domain-containing protein [Streptacidiphilus jiangxiensis]|uniref:PQQ-like domain-containing protein n=1 Tax=Streptacidiphilus jiangxiensis TaxID=235985 RepID=A0A1H7JF09_STRJI|nr:choice-of-anchor D domain-containing protein [Streptacidiphilus jiangxiensis]SEK73143.1 PQQ-like domain-containing protein [Streptacidiphilus jiangxiensis]
MPGQLGPRRAHRRRNKAKRRAVGGSIIAAAVIGGLFSVIAPASQADEYTNGFNNMRTNWDGNESALSPAAVESSTFGKLFSTALDGQIYAQPLVVNHEVIAVTESNSVYALNPDTGAIIWKKNYGAPWPASAIGCGDLAPNVGATGTPVYDPTSNALYFTTKVDGGTNHQSPSYLMHAVDPTSGAEKVGWPVTIQGTPSNEPNAPFNAFYQMQRPGLLLLDGVVYAGFGGHCDKQPYRGYVVGVSTTGHSITSMWASETGASTSGAGIWQSGGGLTSDGSGRIFVSTGNGISPVAGPGTTPQGTLAESVVRLQVGAGGALSTADFFSPSNAATLDLTDKDISSGASMALPDGYGNANHPHLLVQQGKDGRVFLLDRDNLGGQAQGPNGTDAVVGVSGPFQGLWGHPAFWGGDGGYVYLIGNNGPLRALHLNTGGTNPTLTATGQTQDVFGYTSGSPMVTSDGTNDGSAIVWMVSADNAAGANGTLRAYSATPDGSGMLQLLWSAPVGTAAKFATPTADNGKVYVGTRDGVLYGFGSPAATALNANPLDFGQVQTGTAASQPMTLTASKAVTVTGVTATAPFSVPQLTAPKALASGGTLPLQIGFAPTTTGGSNGTLTATLSDNSKLVFSLHGVGTNPGFGALPTDTAFGVVPTGTTETENIQFTNTGTTDETISAVTAPTGSFTATGLPNVGDVVKAGASFVATVTYTPTAASAAAGTPDTSTINVTAASGHSLTVTMTGTSVVGHGHLTFSPPTLDFGTVPVGSSRTQTFTITNDGNIPVTVTKAKAPNGDYTSAVQLSEGLVIGPGQTAKQAVTYAPTTAGTGTASYEVTGDGVNSDGSPQSAMLENLTGVATGSADSTGATSATWQANGAAVLPGDGSIQLNPAAAYQKGSAVFKQAVRTEGLRATFTVKMGPGTGGDGVAFSLLDASRAHTNALGTTGGALGIAGQSGVVVGLDAASYTPVPGYANFVGVANSTYGSTALNYLSTARLATALRQGTHQVDVQVTGGHVLVWVDGVQQLNVAATLPDYAYVAFSGGTGSMYDAHTIQSFVLSGGAAPTTLGYTPLPTQTRVLATWAGVGRPGTTPVPAGGSVSVPIAGKFGVPADATAVVMQVGALSQASATGSIQAWPHGAARPNSGAVFWNAPQIIQKTAVVRLGQGGAVDFYNASAGNTGIYADVLGYYKAGTGLLMTPTTTQVVAFDTAKGIGQPTKAPMPAGGIVKVPVAGTVVPAGTTSVLLNISAMRSSVGGSVSAWPDGGTPPAASVLYWSPNSDMMSNLVQVAVGSDGKIDFKNWANAPMVVNAVVEGYTVAGGGQHYVPIQLFPALNTAYAVGIPTTTAIKPGGVVPLTIAGNGGVPADAKGVLLQVGGFGGTGSGWLGVYPGNGARATTGSLFWNVAGHTVTNMVMVPLDPSGVVNLQVNGSAPEQIQATVVGYYTG